MTERMDDISVKNYCPFNNLITSNNLATTSDVNVLQNAKSCLPETAPDDFESDNHDSKSSSASPTKRCESTNTENKSTKCKRKYDGLKMKRFVIKDLIETIDFGLLPEGWLQLRHVSGLNIYLHRASRVVTLSRPYSIGPGSVRHHRIPVSAIPCLAYRRATGRQLEAIELQKHENNADSTGMTNTELINFGDSSTAQCSHISDSEITGSLTDCLLKNDSSGRNLATDIEKLVENRIDTESETFSSVFSNEINSSPVCHSVDKEEGELSSGDEDGDAVSSEPLNQEIKRACLDSRINLIGSEPNVTNHSMRSIQFVNKRRRRKRGMLFINRSMSGCESNFIQSPNKNVHSSATSIKESETGIQEFSAVKTQVFSIKDKEKESLLTPEDIRKYCSRLFEIQMEDAICPRYRNPSQLVVQTNEVEDNQKPLLMMPEQAKVIRYQLPSVDGNSLRKQPKEGMINMTGKSYVCILHEYCQNVIRRPPTYQTTVLENDTNPYQMTVFINGKPFATGRGQSKKQARLEAAHKALDILIPDFQKIVGSDTNQTGPAVASDRDLQLFDSISVTDPRLYELSVRMALPTPYNLLVECLNRSCVPEADLKSNMTSHGRSKHFFTIQVREHVAKVRCKNKREGRHLAAQHLLAQLHPEVTVWSGLLHMYGPGSKPDKRNELETIQDAQVQQKSTVKASLIRLLKTKMAELADQWESSDGNLNLKGKFMVSPSNLPVVTFHPDADSDLYSSAPVTSSPSSPTCHSN